MRTILREFLVEAVGLYFEIIGAEIERRKLEEIRSVIRRTTLLCMVFAIVSLLFPPVAVYCLGEEIVQRFRCPWRVEIFQEGKWRDMGGARNIEGAVSRLQMESKGTAASWRIRRGNETFPGEIVMP